MLELKQICKSFGKTKVLRELNVSFSPGEITALIGPNGSGKTTMLKTVLGLVINEKGQVLVNGKDIRNSYSYRQSIGYMPQIAHYPENLKVNELISLIRTLRNNPNRTDEELMESLNISELVGKNLGSLSGGQKQKVGAYLAFLFNPEIIILDEPTAGLDPVSTEILKKKISKAKVEKKLIIITTHIMQDAEELADRLVYLMDGSVFIDESIQSIKTRTGEMSLNKALARLLEKK